MRLKLTSTIAALAVLATLAVISFGAQRTRRSGEGQPFGGRRDVDFARKIWRSMDGYVDWKLNSPVYRGQSPHGKWVRLFSTWVTVDGRSYPIVIKDNYGGRGVTLDRVNEDRKAWLKAVTIMLQREEGYDPENNNWFWAKFTPNGSIEKNEAGMSLAGRVAKGMPKGCISCHSQAGKKDYLFSNDE